MRTLDFETPQTRTRINLIKYLANESSMSKRLAYIERYEKKVLREDVPRLMFLIIVWVAIAALAGFVYMLVRYTDIL